LGNVYFIQEPYWPLNTTLYVRDFKGNDPRFISYFLKSVDFLAYSDKAAVPGLNRNHLHQAIVRVPPLPEQRRIAHILGTLDDKIELNRRMNATLEAMARALFKSWFVDFDPVRAKAAGRDPRLPADIAALFPAALVESELGEVPEGWGVGQVGELFNVTMGQSPPGSTYNESAEGLPFYQGRADFDSRYPNRRVYCTAPTRFAQAGDSLVSVRAPVGSLNMAGEECAIGRGLAAVRHKSGSRSFTYYSMQSLESSFSLFEAEGTVFGSINKDAFAGLAAVAPPTAVVSAFESIAYPLDERILLNTQQASTLAALRDTLLPRLLSGAVRVPSVD
jgi:type I restriction enzyme S subunit